MMDGFPSFSIFSPDDPDETIREKVEGSYNNQTLFDFYFTIVSPFEAEESRVKAVSCHHAIKWYIKDEYVQQ